MDTSVRRSGFGHPPLLEPAHSQKAHREHLHEAGHRQRRRQRESGAAQGEHDLRAGRRQFCRAQHHLQREPFADETVERRQRRDRERADQEAERGQRHPSDQAAEPVHVARAGLRLHGADAEKQQRLVKRMIDHVVKRRDEGDGRERRMPRGDEHHPRTDSRDDDTDILD